MTLASASLPARMLCATLLFSRLYRHTTNMRKNRRKSASGSERLQKKEKVNFSVQVPMGKTCELLLYREGNTKPEVCFDMPEEEGIGEVRFLSVEEIDPEKYEYNFLIDGKVCTDPYAKEIAGREVFGKRQNDDKHGVRAKIQVSDYDWGEDRPIRHPWNEVVSYSIHVRGFTKHSSSKVLHRGT